jgi:Cu(I)/Ag(I) efflux system membrane fusion protein/cobalt-zinc-cadmium efflux system membrane fusion protein
MTTESSSHRTALGALAGALAGFLAAYLVFADPFGWLSRPAPEEHVAGGLWTCGMHPNVIQEEPGICPICRMDLVPLAGGDEAAPEPDGEVWSCAMHPVISEPEPGSCPVCGMELVPAEAGAADGRAADGGGGDGRDGVAVRIDPTVVQNMNVRTAPVERRDLTRPIRTVGYLDYDQKRAVTVTTKYSGFVEEVYVNYVGEPVEEGQPLFEVYSPELVQTQHELLSALDFARSMVAGVDDSRRHAEKLVEAARVRLEYWDVGRTQIEHLEQTREVLRTLKVLAPSSGVVIKRVPNLEGVAVRPGMEIFQLADMSSMWLSVEVFEDQVEWVREGTTADVTLSYFHGKSFRGTVRFLEPELSEQTRTMTVTIEVPNPSNELRKGMFATVVFQPLALARALTVPSQAILRTGQRNVVVMALGEGRFAPREVVLGHEAEGYAQVLEGLKVGDQVVVSSQFLLDSESKLREAVRKMIAEDGNPH